MTFTASRRSEKHIYLSVPHMGGNEQPLVQEAFATNWLSTVGPHLDAFEAEFSAAFGLPSAALASGTAAIHLALRLFGIRPGDEVVCPTLTFVATCNPILYEGARPVFIDSDPATWNIDPNLLADFLARRAKVNKLPRAVIVVHLFGQSADLDPILELCRRYELPLLEDAAESMGAEYKGKPVGTFSDVGIYSLNGNKVITSTGGGVLVSPHPGWADKARFWSTQAAEPNLNYLHSELGYNYRMSNVLAAIARGQLPLLKQRVEARRAIAFRFRDALADLPGFELMPQAPYGLHTNWLSCFVIDPAKFHLTQMQLIHYLESANIAARPVWKPMHTQKLYRNSEVIGGSVAEDLNQRGICLPSSSSLSPSDQQFIIDIIREAHSRARK